MLKEKDSQKQLSGIVRIDQRQAPEDVLEELARHILLMRKERNPEYPLLPAEELIRDLRHPPEDTMEFGNWVIYDGKCVAARAAG